MKAAKCNPSWIALAVLILASGQARAAEQLIVQFSTRVPHPPPKENYAPSNVVAVWSEDPSGNFIKTVGRWANNRRNALNVWYGVSGGSDTDAISGATQTDQGTFVTSWSLTARGSGVPVPDGIYKIKMQITWNDGGTPGATAEYSLDKNGTASTQTPADQLDARGYGFCGVTLIYTGRTTTGTPNITLLPNVLDFGQHAAGTATVKTFDVQNLGGGDLLIYAMDLAGPDKGAYALTPAPTLPATIAPEAKQTFAVQFNPAQTRAYNDARVILTSNAPGKETTTVSLAGLGAAPRVGLSVTSLTYGAIAVGANVSKNFNVQNNSGVPLQLLSFRLAGLDRTGGIFSVTAPTGLPLTVNPWGGRQVTVRFTPTSDQNYDYVRLAVGTDDPAARVTTLTLHAQGTRLAHGTLYPGRPIGGPAGAVAMLGATTACVGQGATLAIEDVGDPRAPRRLGEVRLSGPIGKIIVSGGYAYAALGAAGVAVVDVSDPARPRLMGKLDTAGTAYDLALAGTTLCVADGMGGLRLYDLAVPSAPAPGAVFATQGPARGIAATGTLAYVLDEARGLRIVDLSAPANPVQTGEYRAEFGVAVRVANQRAYVTTANRELHVVGITSSSAPYRIALAPILGAGLDIALTSTKIYLAHGAAGMETMDLGTTLPATRGLAPVTGEALDLTLQGSTALVAAGTGGLRLLAVGGAGAPTETGADTLACTGEAVANNDALGAVADGAGGVKFVDLEAYGMARLTGLLGGIGAQSVAIDGSWVYVACGRDGLKAIDLSDPAIPVMRGSFATPGCALGVAVQGTTALVADGLNVYRLNVADPTSITQTGVWASDGYAMGVALVGSYGYVANGGAGLRVLYLPAAGGLTRVGARTLGGVAHAVAVADHTVYVAAGIAGMQIIDVTDKSNPAAPVTYNTPGRTFGVAVRDGTAYLADGGAGLVVVDVRAPATPVLLARSAAPLLARSISVSGDRMVVGDSTGGPVYFMLVNAAGMWGEYE